jgi:indolepyruvate ferredoxin oxidoreductase beta subunit
VRDPETEAKRSLSVGERENRDLWNILMVGVGGQGIILASDILARAAMEAGHDTKKSEIHGMSQRGGSVFSHIRFGKKIFSPIIPAGEADVLFSLEEMETLRWLSYAGAQSLVVVLRTRINPANVDAYPSDVEEELRRRVRRLLFLDPDELGREIDHRKYLNVALLGVLSTAVPLPDDAWRRAIGEEVPEGTFAQNWKAFVSGRNHAAQGERQAG